MAMQQAGDLAATALRKETPTSMHTSTEKSAALPDRWVAAIFKKLGLNYGNLWTSQCPTQQRTDEMIAEWGKALANVKPEHIKRALENLPDMPPTLPQFRKLCIGSDDWQHRGQAYKRFRKELPKPKADPAIARAELAKMRGQA